MSTQVVPPTDWPEIEISRAEQFRLLDARARELEAFSKSTWIELADLCITMRDNNLWKEGGFHSYHAWLKDACPTARSTAYSAVGSREELKDIPDEDLRQIPPGNANILRDVPKARRNGKILHAAKTKTTQEFVATVIEEAPEAHIEQKVCHKFRLTTSQSTTLQGALHMWRILNDDPEAPAEAALEGVVADYMMWHQDEYAKTKQKR